MKQVSFLFFFYFHFFIYFSVFSQTDTVKVYQFMRIERDTFNGKEVIKAEGKEVSPDWYNRYMERFDKIAKCDACMLQYFDLNDRLVGEEQVKNGKYGVYRFFEYSPEGNIIKSGAYKDRKGNDGMVFHGKWTYFGSHNDTLYHEYWKDGVFLRQVPEQSKAEVWKVDVNYHGRSLSRKAIPLTHLNEITVTPYFKNSNRDSSLVCIEFYFPEQDDGYNFGEVRMEISLDSLRRLNAVPAFIKAHYTSFAPLEGYVWTTIPENDHEPQSIRLLNELSPSLDSQQLAYARPMIDSVKTAPASSPHYLVHSLDTSRKVRIAPYSKLNFHYTQRLQDSLFYSKEYHLAGCIDSVNNQKFSLVLNKEETVQQGHYGAELKFSNDFYGRGNEARKRTIDLHCNGYFEYAPRWKQSMNVAGSMLFILSGISAVLVAPIASIHFKPLDFRKERYFKIAGFGLIGVGVSIPLIVIGQDRFYNVIPADGTPACDNWYLR